MARVDSTQARTRLGWRPPWELPAAIDATVDWHLAHRDGRDPIAISLEQIERFSAEASAPHGKQADSLAYVRSPDNEAVVLAMWAAYERDGLRGVLGWAAEDAEWRPHSAEQSVFHSTADYRAYVDAATARGVRVDSIRLGIWSQGEIVAVRGRLRVHAGRRRGRLAHVLGAPRARRQGPVDRLVPGSRRAARGGRAAGAQDHERGVHGHARRPGAAVTIDRAVPNIRAERPAETRDFFVELLGFEVAMDLGWIVTLASPTNPSSR